jgi:uncharacterized protein YggE
MKKTIFAIILLSCVLLLSACTTTVMTSEGATSSGISVSGNAEIEVSPDEATIYFAVETKAKEASDAQDQNSQLMEQVQSALRSEGVGKDDMETTGYNLYQEKIWTREEYIDGDYVVSHSLKVVTNDIEGVGALLVAGVDAGATRVSNIQFGLSDSLEEKVREQLLDLAADNAEKKADNIANALGVRRGKVTSIVVSDGFSIPQPYFDFAESAALARAAEPPIQPGDVSTSTSIQVTFAIV